MSQGITHRKTQQLTIETSIEKMNIVFLRGDIDISPELALASSLSLSSSSKEVSWKNKIDI